ncbi:hypothetical protein [Microbacterium imperiale]|uniref:hypothetical protein n=1 Tax=Microbacterium imperiale TaxID=33884 RepID=UPI001AE3B0A3|nr:hypothetical protein [Microbacterium imperiale]MBP2419665.1 hypothetical protein [Microbacterium imperiale]MDS0198469.1 hypothetical protein [Microbacterium imperiale]
MSGRVDARTSGQRLSDEAARRRRELREEQARHEDTRLLLHNANRLLLQVALCDRLADPRDFELIVGVDRAVDDRGAIVWARVEVLVEVLLQERPHLAAPVDDAPWRRGSTALKWMAAGS